MCSAVPCGFLLDATAPTFQSLPETNYDLAKRKEKKKGANPSLSWRFAALKDASERASAPDATQDETARGTMLLHRIL